MKKLIYLLIFILLIISCDKEDEVTQPQQEIVNKKVLNTSTTKIDTNDNTVNKVTKNSVTVEQNTKTKNLKVGGVIVQGATKDNPDGFARKITAIKKVNGKVVLETKQAKITDVYKELSIRAPITVDYSKKPIVPNNNISGRGVYGSSSNKGVGAVVKFELNENTKEYKYEVIFSKKISGVKGEIKFEGSLKIENEKSEFIYNLRPGTDKVFFVQNGMKVTYTNKITTKGTFKKEAEFVEVARIPLTIPSPTDFVIYPALILKMGVSGKITGEVTVTSTNTLEYDCSLSYTENKGSGWDRIKKFLDSPFDKGNKSEQGQWRTFSYKKFDSKTDFEGKVKLELKAHFTPALRIVLTQYRDAKVGIYLDNYLKFQAEAKPGKIDWDFGYGMDYKAITQFTLIDDDFIKVDYQGKLWEKPYTKLTWGTYEITDKVTPAKLLTPKNGATNVTLNVSSVIKWELANVNNSTTEPISYKLYFGKEKTPPFYQNIPVGGTKPISSISTEPNTTYFWKVEAIDKSGSILATSETWSFTTKNTQTLTPPILLTPTNGATGIENNKGSVLTFTPAKWTNTSTTTKIAHILYFGTSSNPPKHQLIPAGATSPNSLQTKPNTTYYWKIVPLNTATNQEMEGTQVWSFTTKSTQTGGGTPGEKVFVKGGTFTMGSPSGTGSSDERPQHQVTLSDFSIGKYEVTNAEYAQFLNAKGNQTEGGVTWLNINSSYCQIEKVNGSYQAKAGKGNYPVIEVTWYGAKAYAQWVGGRLPTEAEWEYAARGGNQSQGYTYSGSNTLDDVAWYSSNSGNSTHPIGTKNANELGIHDMSGNVWEWCSDWYGSYQSGAQTNPTGPNTGSYRLLRGGSWISGANYCRVTYRGSHNPNDSDDYFGFRVVYP